MVPEVTNLFGGDANPAAMIYGILRHVDGVMDVEPTTGLLTIRLVRFGGMPGDLPRLMGVLLTNRFMVGPSTLSDVLGWAYHFWNGSVFGLVFAMLLGRRPVSWYIGYGVLVGVGFLASPVVTSMGIGSFGLGMPSMPATVVLAHVVYGWALGDLFREDCCRLP